MKKKIWKSLITCIAAAVMSICGTTAVNAAWQLSPNVGWWYQDGNTYYTGWHIVDNKWYYFDQYGWMQTGWLKDGSDWYFLDSTGAMLVNAWAGDYYLGKNGAMVTETVTPDGYYVDASGKWIPDEGEWVLDSNGWWYRYKNGGWPRNEWKEIRGDWYYFKSNGYIIQNAWYENGADEWYYFNSDGRMIENTWAYLDNSWYYFCGETIAGYKQGQIIYDDWIRYKGDYYFMALDGRMATNTWVHNPSTNGEWYVNSSGVYDSGHKKTEIDSFATKYMRSGYRWEYRYYSGQRNIRYRVRFLAIKDNQVTMDLEYSNRNTGETAEAKNLVGTLNGDVIKFSYQNVQGTISLNGDNVFVSAYGGSGLNLSIGGAVCRLSKI